MQYFSIFKISQFQHFLLVYGMFPPSSETVSVKTVPCGLLSFSSSILKSPSIDYLFPQFVDLLKKDTYFISPNFSSYSLKIFLLMQRIFFLQFLKFGFILCIISRYSNFSFSTFLLVYGMYPSHLMLSL